MAATATEKAVVRVSARTLKTALKAVDPAVSSRPLRPVMGSVLLDGGMTATDGELRITVAFDYEGPPALLPYGRIKAIAANVPDDTDVLLAFAGESVTVKAGRGKWVLPVEDAAEFPVESDAKLMPVARFPADQFCRAVASSVIAVDTKSARFALGGVCIDVKDGEVNFVGTDGHRCCVVEGEIDQDVDDSARIVPEATIKAAAKLAASCSGAVQIEASQQAVTLSGDGWCVSGPLLAGQFPRWRDVVKPHDGEPTVVDREELRAAVTAAQVCSDELSRGVTLEFGQEIKLSSRSATNGEAKVKCRTVEAGDPVTVVLDPRYIIEWLDSLPSKDGDPNVTIDAKDRLSSVVFRCDDATNVVMPLNPEN